MNRNSYYVVKTKQKKRVHTMEPRPKRFVNLQTEGQSKTLPDMNLFSQGQFEIVNLFQYTDSLSGLLQAFKI